MREGGYCLESFVRHPDRLDCRPSSSCRIFLCPLLVRWWCHRLRIGHFGFPAKSFGLELNRPWHYCNISYDVHVAVYFITRSSSQNKNYVPIANKKASPVHYKQGKPLLLFLNSSQLASLTSIAASTISFKAAIVSFSFLVFKPQSGLIQNWLWLIV